MEKDLCSVVASLKKRYFMFPHFIDGLVTGEYHELPIAEIERIVEENFFSFAPLVLLDQEQEQILRRQVIKHLGGAINRAIHKSLAGQVLLHEDRGEATLSIDSSPEQIARRNFDRVKLLTPEEKLRFLFNPMNWHGFRVQDGNYNTGLTYYGNRGLVGEYDYYFRSEKDFADLLSKIRESTGQEKLLVLDIGCGMGKALQEMKEIDPNLETHGITQEQEPVMFDCDHYHYILAERFPVDFRNKFHWIKSQVAFRYFIFQNIALRNVLLSLAKGGLATLGFSYEAKHDTEEVTAYFQRKVAGARSGYSAMKVLAAQEVLKLKELQRRGKIKYSTDRNFECNGNQGYLGIEKLEDFDEDDLFIINSDNYSGQ